MDRRVATWHRVDIRRVPTLVKEVDALEKQVAEFKKTLPDTELSILLDAVERRVDEVDELRRTHADDPRAAHLDHQLLRLREVAQTLAKPAPRTAAPNARLFNSPHTKDTPTRRSNSNQQLTPNRQPAKPAKQQPLYKWETKDPAPRSWTKLAPSRDFYILREPGHYSTDSPVLNTLELDGVFEFQIVMTRDEWKTHQYEGRRLAAETKHLERAKKSSAAKTPRYTPSLQTAAPYIEPTRIEKSIYR